MDDDYLLDILKDGSLKQMWEEYDKRKGHYRKHCSECGALIDQCPCAMFDKPTVWAICDKCKEKDIAISNGK